MFGLSVLSLSFRILYSNPLLAGISFSARLPIVDEDEDPDFCFFSGKGFFDPSIDRLELCFVFSLSTSFVSTFMRSIVFRGLRRVT